MKHLPLFAIILFANTSAPAQTADEWIGLGTKVHGTFGAFIPLGIKVGLDSLNKLGAKPRDLTVIYYDSNKSPCACIADGIAIATTASVGQRSLIISAEKAPDDTLAVVVIRPRIGGAGFKYTIPAETLSKIVAINQSFDPKGRFDAVMAADDLFNVEPIP